MSNDEIARRLDEIAKKQDDLILLFAGRLDWNAAENAARFPGCEPPYTFIDERDGRIEVNHCYPIASDYTPT